MIIIIVIIIIIIIIIATTTQAAASKEAESRPGTSEAKDRVFREFRDVVFEDVVFDNNSCVTIYYGKHISLFVVNYIIIKHHILKHHIPELRSIGSMCISIICIRMCIFIRCMCICIGRCVYIYIYIY